MSDGANKSFTKNPQQFMQTHQLNSSPDPSLIKVRGLCKINIIKNSTTNSAKITKANDKFSLFSHAFKAYYLPWAEGAAPAEQLGTQADYFFTAGITGCRLIIGAGSQPLVTHVDGGYYNDTQMDNMCNTRANGVNFNGQRYWDNGNYYATIVVGVRNKNGWQFFAQSYNKADDTNLAVQQI